MKCSSCGFENEGEAKFCGSCGAVLAAPPRPPAPPGPQIVPDGFNLGIILGSLLVPLLGIILGAMYINDPNPEKKKAGKRWLLTGAGVIVAYCVLGFFCGLMGNLQ
ncbi:MAG: zinc ribbon domain-containing protein [Hydrogenophilales bacterium]|nr:zinc ribbon domain-containing protein [Hydrogenophilales bacterium]